ncbi:MAG: sulfite exporter TauE/SafE family protein [Candidatus Thiodiazotropha sp.]
MLEALSTLNLIIAATIICSAYLVRGIAGFGSGLIAIPLLALMLPLSIAVPLIVLLDYIASASHGVKHREAIRWRDIMPLLPFSIFGVVMALYLFNSVDADVLQQLLQPSF